jgi:hypothetical protein
MIIFFGMEPSVKVLLDCKTYFLSSNSKTEGCNCSPCPFYVTIYEFIIPNASSGSTNRFAAACRAALLFMQVPL